MKTALRIFVLSLFAVSVAAAATAPSLASRQAASASFPAPACGPHIPTCGDTGSVR